MELMVAKGSEGWGTRSWVAGSMGLSMLYTAALMRPGACSGGQGAPSVGGSCASHCSPARALLSPLR